MTLVALTADIHVGNHLRYGGAYEAGINRRGRQVIEALDRSIDVAAENGASLYGIAGDLVDSLSIRPQILGAAMEVLAQAPLDILILLGNHDQNSTLDGDNALRPFRALPNVRVIEKPQMVVIAPDLELVCVPFQPGRADGWFAAAVAEAAKGTQGFPRAILTHLGIRDSHTAPWLREAADSIDVLAAMKACEDIGANALLAGNWHERKEWGPSEDDPSTYDFPQIMQIGALAPTGFDNPGLDGYGTVALYDGESIRFAEVPGPRFLKLEPQYPRVLGDPPKIELPITSPMHQLYVEVTVTQPEDLVPAQSWIESMAEQGRIVAGEAVLSEKVLANKARAAAQLATSMDTLDQAVAAYVKEMPLESNVDRARVLAEVRQRLKL